MRGFTAWRRDRLQETPGVSVADAEEFLVAFHGEHPGVGDVRERIREVRAEVARTGTYVHTPAELSYAARAAWRHSARCSGRYPWRTLRVRDRRHLSEPGAVAAETVTHLREATNSGRVRSVITVFAPDRPNRPGPRIVAGQVIRYAGYRQGSGSLLGDPENVGLTELAVSLGWKPGRTAFDILPLIVRDAGGRLHRFDIPSAAVLEVPISHPDFEWFTGLDLRWYAVPVISDMYLDAGGIRYPCVPFNGWYQAATEVGARDLGDAARYDMLPAVAAGMGLDMAREDTLWQDRAVTELAVAVHHSYRQAGVMVTDHHTEARRLMKFIEAEEEAGRPWCAEWSWVVPPIGGSTTPLFHRTYPEQELKPRFARHPAAV
jgi:nitric-oxide synthase